MRACGARPSAGGKRGGEAFRGKRGDNAEGGSLGGARSPRPSGKAELAPRRSISTTSVNDGPVAYRGHARVKPMVSSRACGARPSAGGKRG